MLAAGSASAQPALPADVIVTTGEAIVRRAPDRAFVTVTVETRAKGPRDAQRLNAEAMSAVQQRLDQARVPKDAVRTQGYDLQQEFDFTGAGPAVDRVIKVEDVRDGGVSMPRPLMAMARAADAATTPIEPGLVEVHARVTLTAAMR